MPFLSRMEMVFKSPKSLFKDFAERKKPDLMGFIVNVTISSLLITLGYYVQYYKLYSCYLQLVGGKVVDARRFIWFNEIIPNSFRYTVLMLIYVLVLTLVPYLSCKAILKKRVSFTLLLSINGYLMSYMWVGLLISILILSRVPKVENIVLYPFMFSAFLIVIKEYTSQPIVMEIFRVSRIVNMTCCIVVAVLFMMSFSYIITNEKRKLITLYILTSATLILLFL